jgi:Flp pilus assembly protein TadB
VADTARVTEFDLFAEVLALHAGSGGNLPAMLDRLAASIRDRNQYRGYFRSVTTLARVRAYFVALAAPAALLLYFLFQRDMLDRFVAEPVGQRCCWRRWCWRCSGWCGSPCCCGGRTTTEDVFGVRCSVFRLR